jgi:uncharacterized membrane protein YraQ (UPF0718 family)
MKNLKRISLGYILAAVFAVFLVFAELFDIQAGQRMAGEFYTFSMKMVLLMPCTFILIGLLDVWIPKEQIKKHIGEESGLRGAVYIILLAVFQGGPLYVAFPAAHLLWKKGCSMRNIFLYLGAFSTVKIPMILFEASFLGWRFALVRAAAALPVFVIIAEIMTVYTRRAGLQLEQLEDHDSNGC